MVIDTLDKFVRCLSMNPLFKDVADFLCKNDLRELPEGKYNIKGDDLYLNITTAKGKTPEEAVMETHNRMIDIQIPLSAPEMFGYSPRYVLPEADYNEEKDITKIPGVTAESYVICRPGMFAIFFPDDGHAPCISTVSEIKKAIFKVLA